MYRSNNTGVTLLVLVLAAFVIGFALGSNYQLQPRTGSGAVRR